MNHRVVNLLSIPVFALTLAACDSPDDDPNRLVPDNRECSIDVATGLSTVECHDTTFSIAFPETCETESCGLIVDLHGHGYDADGHDVDTSLRQLGNDAGFVVVQPTAGTEVLGSPLWYPQDDAKVTSFVEKAVIAWNVDMGRVHVSGHDSGGWMTWRLVCDRSDLFASAAVLGAGASACPEVINPISCDFTEEGPGAQMDLLVGHGAQDEVVDLECTTSQLDDVADVWGLETVETIEPMDGITKTMMSNSEGTDVEFVVHDYVGNHKSDTLGDYGGHCVPGGHGQLGCSDSGEYDWGAEVVSFFEDHSR